MRRSTQLLPRLGPATILAACGLLSPAGAAPASQRSAQDLEREEFLRRAAIRHVEAIPVGVTHPLRATLSLDGLTHDAHIQRIDAPAKRRQTHRGTYAFYRDSYRYNIAAYRLDRLLGLGMVPVSVERRYLKSKAAFTWWVDDVVMTDAERFENDVKPPDVVAWADQKHQARIFHQLISNEDANLGNLLIAEGWRLWLVDFTRAFHADPGLQSPLRIDWIDRRLYDGLVALTPEDLAAATSPWLSGRERQCLMARRDAILERLDGLIAAKGEDAVICNLPRH